MKHHHKKTLPHLNETYSQVSEGGVHNRKAEVQNRAARIKHRWPEEILPLSSVKPAKRNARTHSKKQIRQIADCIEQFGFINPLIVDEHGQIIAGHARWEAAKLLGMKFISAIRLSNFSESEIRAYMLADNKLAAMAGWDREMLAIEFEELQIALPQIGLELGITGFDPAEVDSIMADFGQDHTNPADQMPDLDDAVVAQQGDLFVLGQHRLAVGDARDENVYARLMQSNTADMAFLDPPYNVKINGHVGGRGRIKHREFAHASGEMSPDQFIRFLQNTLGPCARRTVDGGITYICMDWRHARELLEAGAAVYDDLKNVCVWTKTAPGQGSFYRSQHELVFVYKRGKAPHLNTFELGQHGRTRSNVWVYAGVNTFRAGRMDELKMHPTVKPVALIADAMRDCSRRGSIILDAFAGSGTTIMAAEQIGRRAFCIEIDPRYVDVAIRRWQQFTGKDATLESTGQTFEEVLTARAPNPSQTKTSRWVRRRVVKRGR
jgi:DNA modification methylase